MNYKRSLALCTAAARAGGDAIKHYSPETVNTKDDKYVGSHAIVTDADFESQDAILRELKSDITACFITEEHVKDSRLKKRLITKDSFDMMDRRRVYVIDELDGSSSFNTGHYEWSVSVGCVDNINHSAGAVYAPRIENGIMFFGSKDDGAFVYGEPSPIRVSECDRLGDAYVLYGPDNVLTKYPVHNRLMNKLGDISRTTNMNGSCALGLGLVACGRADALVQPLQCPWDWAAGKVIVEEAGGKIIFYEMQKTGNVYDKIIPVTKLEPRHYNPEERTLGFVAANEHLAEEIMDLLAQ